jgi:hypothetical protein
MTPNKWFALRLNIEPTLRRTSHLFLRLTFRSLNHQLPHSAVSRHFTITIVASDVRLRGLVQPVLSPRRSFGDLSET